jgi:hypothetical protein
MPVQLVLAQVIGGKQVPDPGGAVQVARIRCRGARPGSLLLPLMAGPLPAGAGLQVQVPELVQAKDRFRFAGAGDHLSAGDRVQVHDAGLLHRILRSFEVF